MQSKNLHRYIGRQTYNGPVFLYFKDSILDKVNVIKTAFSIYPKTRLLYAIKANNYPEVAELLIEEKLGTHVSSLGEYNMIKNSSGYISHTGPFVDNKLLESKDARLHFNLNSYEEIKLFKNTTKLGLRINPGTGWSLTAGSPGANKVSHLGVPYKEIIDVKLPKNIVRLHMHNNSDSLETKPFVQGFKKLLGLAYKNSSVMAINIGGGIGTPISTTEVRFNIELLASTLKNELLNFYKMTGRELELQIECGNFFVRESGIYVCQIKNVLIRSNRYLYYTDGSEEHLRGCTIGRTAQAFYEHKIHRPSSLFGATCRSDDVLAQEISLPLMKAGDLVYFKNSGAYCAVRSTNFNTIGLPHQLLI